MHHEVLLNINVPPQPSGRWRVGGIGQLEYFDVVEQNSSVRSTSFDASSTKIGLAYGDGISVRDLNIGDEVTFTLKGGVPPELRGAVLETDYQILNEGDISVTPLVVHPVVHDPTRDALLRLQAGG